MRFQADVRNVVINRGIPVPIRYPRGGKWATLLGRMEPGDSVFFPCATKQEVGSLRAAVGSASRRLNQKVSTRMVDGGLRFWLL